MKIYVNLELIVTINHKRKFIKKLSLLLLLLIGKQIKGAEEQRYLPLSVFELQEPPNKVSGLRFTKKVIEEINSKNVQIVYATEDLDYNNYVRITPTFCMHAKYCEEEHRLDQYTSTEKISEQDTRCDECKNCYNTTIEEEI